MDGPAKVTGKALYVDDLHRPGLLHGATIRSDVSRGRLLALTPDPDFDWSGLTVVTAGDVPCNVVALIEEDQPVLVPVGGEIRHRYEAIALVAGEDPERVAAAAERLRAEVAPLPPVLSIADALSARVVIHGIDNVQKRYRITKGEGADALARCEVVLSGTYRSTWSRRGSSPGGRRGRRTSPARCSAPTTSSAGSRRPSASRPPQSTSRRP